MQTVPWYVNAEKHFWCLKVMLKPESYNFITKKLFKKHLLRILIKFFSYLDFWEPEEHTYFTELTSCLLWNRKKDGREILINKKETSNIKTKRQCFRYVFVHYYFFNMFLINQEFKTKSFKDIINLFNCFLKKANFWIKQAMKK